MKGATGPPDTRSMPRAGLLVFVHGSLSASQLRMGCPCRFLRTTSYRACIRRTRPPRVARSAPPPSRPKPSNSAQQRLKKGRAKKRQLRQRLVEDDDAVLTFKEWCALNGHSERQGRRILTSGNGPTVTQLSDRRIGISRKQQPRLASEAGAVNTMLVSKIGALRDLAGQPATGA